MILTSVRKKQLVAITGFMMVGFLFAHLSGNLIIYKGYEAYNAYADFLHSLGPLLWVMRIGLIGATLLHIVLTVQLTIDAKRARDHRYESYKDHRRSSIASKFMPLTGVIVLAYIIIHLLDFTFASKDTFIIDGINYGLYGLVVTTLSNPIHALFYIAAVLSAGLHVSHGIQSVCQTIGVANRDTLPKIEKISLALGFGMAMAYASIPIYIVSVF